MKKTISFFMAFYCVVGWIQAQRIELPDKFFTGQIGLGYSEKSIQSGNDKASISNEFNATTGGGFHKRIGSSWMISTTLLATHRFYKEGTLAKSYSLQLPLGIGMSRWTRLFTNGNIHLVAGAAFSPSYQYSTNQLSNATVTRKTNALGIQFGAYASLAWHPLEKLIIQLPMASLSYNGLFSLGSSPDSTVHGLAFSLSSLGNVNVFYLLK